jgi:hypothetical protein
LHQLFCGVRKLQPFTSVPQQGSQQECGTAYHSSLAVNGSKAKVAVTWSRSTFSSPSHPARSCLHAAAACREIISRVHVLFHLNGCILRNTCTRNDAKFIISTQPVRLDVASHQLSTQHTVIQLSSWPLLPLTRALLPLLPRLLLLLRTDSTNPEFCFSIHASLSADNVQACQQDRRVLTLSMYCAMCTIRSQHRFGG